MRIEKILLITLIMWFFLPEVSGQIFDFSQADPYQKVFVETDDFDTSYLTILESTLPRIHCDTLRFEVLNDLAYYWHTRDLNKALILARQGLHLAKEKNFPLWHGRFQITEGAILLRQEKLDSARQVLQEAQGVVPEKDLPLLYTQMGYVYERKGQLDSAANYAQRTMELGEGLHDNWAIGMANSDLSNLFWKQGKYSQALEYGLKSLSTFRKRGIRDLDYDFTLYIVGNVYAELNQPDEALGYFLQAKDIGELYGFYNNLSDIYISMTDLYTNIGRFEEAQSAARESVHYANLIDNAFLAMRAYLSLGKLQNKEKNYIKAIEILETSIEIATRDFGDEYYLSQVYEELGKAYAQLGNYNKAYQSFLHYDSLQNNLFTAESDQRLATLQTQYEVAQKETTIKLQETRLNQQQIREQLTLIIVLLLLAFLAALFISFRKIRKKRKLLEKQNQEKEFLLKEIHHRVKNNLEVVSSLLALQSAQADDPNVLEAMRESRNRVYSMGIIHQKLYQGKALAAIEMKDYFTQLGIHILDSFGATNHIKMDCEMKPMELDVKIAIPLGLIVNELLTNALKYAFPDQSEGQIRIVLYKESEDKLRLEVADDGIGWEENKVTSSSGFGSQLIQLLTQQLDGELIYDHSHGTTVKINIDLKKAA